MDYVELRLLNEQVEVLLQALQLYAFNFHNTWNVKTDSDEEDKRNALIFYTYEYLSNNYNYTRPTYDVLKACRTTLQRKKRKIYYKNKKIA